MTPRLLLTLCVLAATCAAQAPDLIIIGENIETMDPRFPRPGGIAIRGDRIAAVGSREKIMAMRGKKTDLIDAGSTFVMPGIVESHAHFTGIGAQLRTVDLVGTRSYDELVERILDAASKTEKGRWIVGRGWDQNLWAKKSFPSHGKLSAATPNHPVYLTRVDGHAAFVNKEAMRRAKLKKSAESPTGGELIRSADGELTGVLIDRAMGLVSKAVPGANEATIENDMIAAQALAFEQGITSMHDAGASRGTIAIMDRLYREGRLKLRLYVMLSAGSLRSLGLNATAPRRIGDHGHRLTVRSFKLYMDGALGSRGAAMLEDYADRHGHRGLPMIEVDQLVKMGRLALEAGYQVNVHAIGDAGNRRVVDAWDRLFLDRPEGREARFRIEHAQILDEKEIPRMARLGVIASMQGVHCTSDMDWVPTRIGEARSREGAYVWRRLLEAGVVVCNGTDAPVEGLSPFECLYATVTRQHHDGKPGGGWFPAQRMSRLEALHSYTLAGAYAAFEENLKGSITPGKLADITIVDRDLIKVPAKEIIGAKVVKTIVGGEVVYSR